MPHKPHKLTHDQAKQMLWGIFVLALIAEGGLAMHAFSAHDVVTGSLVLTTWGKESLIRLVEYIAS